MARAKGTTFIPLVRLLRSQREQAVKLVPPELGEYLEKRILELSWYPESALLGLLRAAAELLGGDRDERLREFGRIAAREHLQGGIYAHLRFDEDPFAIPLRAFALWSAQHDSGRLRVVTADDGTVFVRVEDYDSPSPEMCLVTSGYIEEVLSQSGLAPLQLEKQMCCNRGDALCEWRVSPKSGSVVATTPRGASSKVP